MKQNSQYRSAGSRRSEADERPATDGAGRRQARVFSLLKRRRADEKAESQVPMLQPEDTGTRLALREAERGGAPISYAVQLEWSAQPIDLHQTPRDPIFRSYTLYTTRARRDGRQWFELRLGFFRDTASAKQVACYLRSTFDSAAVVPVSQEEQEAARAAAGVARQRAADAGAAPVI